MSCGSECAPILVQLLIYGLTNGAVVALNAVGFTLAYAVARQINLAHGNVFALASVGVAYLALVVGVPTSAPLGARLAALIVLCLGGAVFGAALNGAIERL